MKNKKAFTLIELLLAITLMGTLITVVAFNFDSLWANKYSEAKENLKTFLINHKHKATYFQKDSEIYFDDLYNLYGNFEDVYLLENITNDLKIVESSSTKIVFFLDGIRIHLNIILALQSINLYNYKSKYNYSEDDINYFHGD